MNIDKVYICDIYRMDKINYNCLDFSSFDGNYNLDKFLRIKRNVTYVKTSLVYFSIIQGGFIDLETGQWYRLGYPSIVGELFVDVHKNKVNGYTLMGTDRKHYSKRKILKRYNEYNYGDKRECK